VAGGGRLIMTTGQAGDGGNPPEIIGEERFRVKKRSKHWRGKMMRGFKQNRIACFKA
jgi:hypothetical protein